MKKCANCTYTTENDEKFCPSCGGELIADAKAEVVPAQKNPGKSKAIAGMILSAIGMGLSVTGSGSILSLVLGIVGMMLSNQAIAAGDTSTFSSLGKTFGKVAVIVSIVVLVIAIVIAAAYFLLYMGILLPLITEPAYYY